jgi:hypothetical protein
MPRLKPSTRKRVDPLTEDEKNYLLGYLDLDDLQYADGEMYDLKKSQRITALLELEYPYFEECGTKHVSTLWAAHKDELLGEYIKDHPCTRPGNFWTYDWPQYRDDRLRNESQTAYLKRNGLLTKAEIKYLKAHPELLENETEDDA